MYRYCQFYTKPLFSLLLYCIMPFSSLSTLIDRNCSCEDVFTCLYNLSTSDIQILGILLRSEKKGPLTLDYLGKQVNRDKGTVFRSLQKLVGMGFCTKQTRFLRQGGYYHVYSAADISTIEKNVDERISNIQLSLHRIRRRFRVDIKKIVSSYAFTVQGK
jgi:predicted transcriptional regulator